MDFRSMIREAQEAKIPKPERLGLPGGPADWVRWRKGAGLTQSDVAAMLRKAGLDVSRQTVANWETGRYLPTEHYAPAFARFLEAAREIAESKSGKGKGAK